MVGTRNVLSFFQVSFHGWGLNCYFSKQICLLTEAKFSCCSVLIGQQRACRLGLAVVGMIWNSVSLRGKKRPLQSWVLQKGCLTPHQRHWGWRSCQFPHPPFLLWPASPAVWLCAPPSSCLGLCDPGLPRVARISLSGAGLGSRRRSQQKD